MIVTYLRSSSIACHDLCAMQYYLQYILGWKTPSNLKAEKGTVVHKVLELLGAIKLNQQNKVKSFDDDIVGKVWVNKYSLDKLIDKVFEYYSQKSTNCFNKKDYSDCVDWTQKAITYKGGYFDPRNNEIIKAEQAFDFEINKPWSMYSYDLPDGQKLEGFLALKGTIDQISKVDDKTYMILDWKGLPIDTMIPTINGWTTMGELSVGDIVFDEDGQQTTVIGKSQPKIKKCYKITFDDTTQVVCDDEHLWKKSDGKTVSITNLKIQDKINVTKPLVCGYINLPIDPYVLGLWLGDGRNSNGEICNSDEFIFEEIKRRGYDIGDNINKTGTCPSRTVYGLRTKLKSLSLNGNKHIPKIYLRASYTQRLDLLRGLMDSDGNANPKRKQAVFTSCSKILSDNVKELLLSLGQRPNQASITKEGFGLVVDVYPVHFRPIDLNPFLLPRKANQIDPKWGSGNSHRRLITNIELIEEKTTQCIMVDSKSSTYLCTENMIPTHNTGRRWDWATDQEKTYAKLNNDHQLMMYYYAAQFLYPEIDNIHVCIYFINDGGEYDICFSKTDIPRIENMLQAKFEKIKNTKIPALSKSWKCKKFCHFGKSTFEGTSVQPIIEHRPNQVTPLGEYMTKCEQTLYCLQHRPEESVRKNMTAPNHTVDFYNKPGT